LAFTQNTESTARLPNFADNRDAAVGCSHVRLGTAPGPFSSHTGVM
jgi:hypothetical protein